LIGITLLDFHKSGEKVISYWIRPTRVRFEPERTETPFLFFFLITGTPFRSFSAYSCVDVAYSESVKQKQQVAVRFSCVYNVYTRFLLTILLQVSLK